MTSVVCETSDAEKYGFETDELDFEANILILGMIAQAYAATPGPCPQRGWGGRPSPLIRDGNRTWTVATGRKNGRVTIQITVNDEEAKTRRTFHIPREALDKVSVTLPAAFD